MAVKAHPGQVPGENAVNDSAESSMNGGCGRLEGAELSCGDSTGFSDRFGYRQADLAAAWVIPEASFDLLIDCMHHTYVLRFRRRLGMANRPSRPRGHQLHLQCPARSLRLPGTVRLA